MMRTNYYVNLPISDNGLGEKLAFLEEKESMTDRFEYIQSLTEEIKNAWFLWPISTDNEHRLGLTEYGDFVISDDGNLQLVGSTEENGAFYVGVYLDMDVAVTDWSYSMVRKIDVFSEFQNGIGKFGGIDIHVSDELTVRILEYELAPLQLTPALALSEEEPIMKSVVSDKLEIELSKLQYVAQLYQLDNRKKQLMDDALIETRKELQQPLSGSIAIIVLLIAYLLESVYHSSIFSLIVVVAIVKIYQAFHVSKKELNDNYNKKLSRLPYVAQINEMSAKQVKLGDQGASIINQLPEYMRDLATVNILTKYLKTGKAATVPEAIQLYEQN
ncbi:hypothetical protein FO433_05795 [Weissella cibaria]|uniref:hypothetical protein n=2 Tax=Weissella cibaria TaxID=137591 RepID=UPI001193FDF2|nr:hypothetical protein [Weissella cibaria]TVV25318.1 hypothetical protein FO433_05795 [Weissella cibaria]